jgi:uncharacterized protein YkuJ
LTDEFGTDIMVLFIFETDGQKICPVSLNKEKSHDMTRVASAKEKTYYKAINLPV